MARTPDGLTARSVHVTARFRPSTVTVLDRLRGKESRAKYIEKLIHEDEKNQREKK